MTMARWEQTITDDRGNIVPGASVEVRREGPGLPLEALYTDRGGTTPLGNPFTTGSDGVAAFHSRGGSFRITITKGTFTRVLRYVPIGLAQESDDSLNVDPQSAWNSVDTFSRNMIVSDQGASWIAKRENANAPPPTLPTVENDDWLLLSAPGAGIVGSALQLEQIATPSPPAAGHNQLYFKDDDKLYKQTSAGVETEVGAGGGGGSPYPPGFIFGLTFSNDTTDATNDLAIAAGACRDKTNAINIDAGAMIKRLDANWAPGTNQGFRYSGAAITNGSYHVYAICKALGADADYYADPSADNATALGHVQAETGGSDYIYARRIGSFKRVSGSIWSFIQDGDRFTLASSISITASASAQSSTLVDAQVPAGITVGVITRSFIETGSPGAAFESLGSAAMGSANIITFGASGSGLIVRGMSANLVTTNTSAQIYRAFTIQSGSIANYNCNLLGYFDRRGQDGGV